MKQPKNEIVYVNAGRVFRIGIKGSYYATVIARGLTKLAALKTGLRRAERIVRDIERMIEAEK